MFRRYEDPHKVQEMLDRARQELEDAKREVEISGEECYDRMIDLYQEVSELEERLNFAWQDDEYEEQYMLENYGPDWME